MLKLPDAEETALLVARLFNKSGQKRARLSEQTIRRLSRRRCLRHVFIRMLEDHLNDLGLVLVQLDRGGYGLIPAANLEGAPTITVKKYMRDELPKWRKPGGFGKLRAELVQDAALEDEDE